MRQEQPPKHLRVVEATDTAGLLSALESALNGGSPVLVLPCDGMRQALLAAAEPEQPVEHDDITLVVPTTGSTGAPKIVLLPRAALLHSAAATAERLGGPGQWVLALPPTHVGGLQVLVRSVVAGTRPVVVDAAGGFRAEGFLAATGGLWPGRRYTSLVPTQLRRLLASEPALEALRSYDAVLVGGAATSKPLLAEAAAAGIRVVTTYGMTETCGGCVYDGTALADVTWELTPEGRIRLAGPVLARGYRLQPELTAAAFMDGWFTTQDLGERAEDGRLRVLGRVDDVIMTGAVKVSARAIEESLLSHPAVRDAAVVGAPDDEWGQRVVAAVEVSRGVPGDTLREHVAAELGRPAAPRQVMVVDAVPLVAPGKVDRAALVKLADRESRSSTGTESTAQ